METNVKSIELKDLWRRYKRDGDDRARERLVVAYSPLVKYVSGRMASGLLQISRSSVAALDELWSVSDASGDQVSLLDTLHDPDAPDPAAVVDATDLKDRIADAIARLPEREKLVVALYYYENLTLREIGEVLGVTESRVSQLHTKAVLRLRGHLSHDDVGD